MEVKKTIKIFFLIWISIFLLQIFKNNFKFYQLYFINICKFNKCFSSHEILFDTLIWNVYFCIYFLIFDIE